MVLSGQDSKTPESSLPGLVFGGLVFVRCVHLFSSGIFFPFTSRHLDWRAHVLQPTRVNIKEVGWRGEVRPMQAARGLARGECPPRGSASRSHVALFIVSLFSKAVLSTEAK